MKRPPADELFFAPKKQRSVPHAFVLDALAPADPVTRPMFGCIAAYVDDKIVLIFRDKPAASEDNGVWVATTREHHESLRRELPSLRSIKLLGAGVTGWQNLPADAPCFEEEALRAVELILAGDPRIGKIPEAKRAKGPGRNVAAKKPGRAPRRTSRRS